MPSRARPRRRRAAGSDHGSDADATDGLLATAGANETSGDPNVAVAPMMPVLFARKTPRVKAIAIHPSRPLVLFGLHSGSVRCYDLDHLLHPDTAGPGVVVNAEVPADGDDHDPDDGDHDGTAAATPPASSGGLWSMTFSTEHYPVRTVAWCPQDPNAFAVGDDAYAVHVCRITGASEENPEVLNSFHHSIDYIRSVQYHPQKPLLLVASDDMDIQIYDWQKRIRIATAAGHVHYVMRSVFHPTLPVFASASLDLTVRLWKLPSDDDIAAHTARQMKALDEGDESAGGGCCGCVSNWFNSVGKALAVTLLSVGESHERGLNWVEFSGSAATPRELATSSDDRAALLWVFDDNFALSPLRRITRRHNNISFVIPIIPSPQQQQQQQAVQRVYFTGGEYGTVDLHAETGSMYPAPRFEDGPAHSERGTESKSRFWTAAVTPAADVVIAGHDAGFVGLRVPPCASQGGFSDIEVPLAA